MRFDSAGAVETHLAEKRPRPGLGRLLRAFWGAFWLPGTTLGAILGSLGLFWAPLGSQRVPNGSQSREKDEQNEVLNLLGCPKGPKGCQWVPKGSKKMPPGLHFWTKKRCPNCDNLLLLEFRTPSEITSDFHWRRPLRYTFLVFFIAP